eukprot:14655204-Alexandrium_andersonii.AAC.1
MAEIQRGGVAEEPEAVPHERAQPGRDQGGSGSSGGYGSADSAWRTWPSWPPADPGGAVRAGGEDELACGRG